MPNSAPQAKRVLRILALLLGVTAYWPIWLYASVRINSSRTQRPLAGAFFSFSAWRGSHTL